MEASRFRADVEGLRGLAIVLVVLAHAGVGGAAGGFVGVDVFFVISGFVITRVLVAELEATGSLSLTRFYARRVKRLMPQALAAIAAVVVAAPLLLSPVSADAVAEDVVAAGSYAMNWHLSAGAVDYFATGEDRPLDHFWSLAVEEQFYLAWPLLLLVLTRGGVTRRRLLAALTAIAAASLAYAIAHVHRSPDQAYFSVAARGWELALGGLLAVGLAGRRAPRALAAVAGWAGVVAIATATVSFGPATAMPGLPALLPTLGAAALVVAGTSRTPPAPTRALATPPACHVGRISYAWYVWHWPVLVFAGPGVPAALASLAPAIVTYRSIEVPMRRLKLTRPRLTLATALAAPAFAACCAIAMSATIPSPRALPAGEAEGAGQLQRTGAIQESADGLRPRPRDAADDRGRSYEDGCLVGEHALTSPPCVYGDRRAKRTVVLFGDSHAMMYFPALDRLARRRHWRLVQVTKSGCPPPRVRVVYTPSGREYRDCDTWRDYALRRIERDERPRLVIAATSAHYTVVSDGRRLDRDAGARALAAGYAPTLRRLASSVPKVAVIADPPRPPFDAPTCVSEALEQLRRCAFRADRSLARARVVTAGVRRVEGVRVVDPAGLLCLDGVCPSVIGDVLVYRNTGHLTASFVETMTGWLGRRLPRP
jgi:peptidoglycan/LPS O-acetylase OafA/YrhL